MSRQTDSPVEPIHPRRIGVVIVTYQSEHEIGACLESLASINCDIVVVDNASQDETLRSTSAHPVTVIANPTNRGFAAAANQGFAALSNEWVLLLNPDVVVTPQLTQLFLQEMPADAGALTAILTGPSGESQAQFQFRRFPTPFTLLFEIIGLNRLWPTNAVNRRYRYLDKNWNSPCSVEQPAGALLLVRHAAWQRLGGFDELFYPLWFEDVDFCRRLVADGFTIRLSPVVAGRHAGGHSIRHLEPGIRQLYWYRSLLRYAQKHFSLFWVRVLALAVSMSLLVKSLPLLLQSGRAIGPRSLFPAMQMSFFIFIHGRHPLSETTR